MTDFMALALEEAQRAGDRGEIPVGAVLVEANSDQVIAAAGNEVEARSDPTAHAESLVIRAAASILQTPRLPQLDLYVTLEPCPMCATAISFARIRRLIFGAYDPKGGGVEHGPAIFQQPTCHHTPEVVGGVQEAAAGGLLRGFFQSRR